MVYQTMHQIVLADQSIFPRKEYIGSIFILFPQYTNALIKAILHPQALMSFQNEDVFAADELFTCHSACKSNLYSGLKAGSCLPRGL